MNLPTLVSELWALMGPKMRRGLLTVVGISLVIILVMFAYLAYSTGEVYRRTGFLPTRADLDEQTTEVVGEVNELGLQIAAVALALDQYKDSLAGQRTHLDTTLIAPGLLAVVDLQRRMAKLESGQVATRIAIEEQKQQGHQSTVALIAQMNRQSSSEARAKEQQQRREQEERERDRALMQAIAKKLKIADPYDTR